MRSLLGPVLNKTPVPYAPRGLTLPWSKPDGAAAQMQAYGAVGTLFNIVSTTSQAVAEVEWKLWRKSTTGDPNDRVEVTSHLALDIWNQPNKFMTRQELVEIGQQHIDLTGEGWLVVSRNPSVRSIPLELWPVRPDQMAPQPSPTDFIVGYWFTGPNGERMPLPVEDVLFMRMPNPLDPYRGMGPVQSVLLDIDSSHYAAQWNRNFFLNSAQPGGIIQVDKRLTDDEFTELTTRWREQHQGVANAHRVAVIEQGQWVNNNYTVKDMQFVELRTVSKEKIREAYGFPKFAAGEVDDVNRATANASAAWFAKRLTVPRLQRWKGMLNNDYLPLFGSTTRGLEFDYISPVMEDREANNAERDSITVALKTLTEANVEIDKDVLSYLGLPPTWTIKEPELAPAPPIQAQATVGEPVREIENGAPRNVGGSFLDLVGRFRRHSPLNHLPGKHDQSTHGGGGRFDGALSGDEALKAAGLKTEPNADQAAALRRMGGDGAYVVNADLRTAGDLTAKNQATIDQLDPLMERSSLPEDVVVYRHVGSGRGMFGMDVTRVADLTGMSWRDKGYVSTSVADRGTAGGHRVNMRILAPKGIPGFSHSELDSDEILLGRGLTYSVVGDNGTVNGVRQVDVVVSA